MADIISKKIFPDSIRRRLQFPGFFELARGLVGEPHLLRRDMRWNEGAVTDLSS
jgi:hypothetical protein